MSRWISITCFTAMLGALVLCESYRREAQQLQTQVLELASRPGLQAERSPADRVSVAQAARNESSEPAAPRGGPEATSESATTAARSIARLTNSEIVALADELSKRRTRPTQVDIEMMERLERSKDPREREAIARRLLESPHGQARLAGILEVVKSSPREGLDLLVGFVDKLAPEPFSADYPLARDAIYGLAKISDTAAEKELYRYFDSAVPEIRTPAARALELRGISRPMEQLIAEFQNALRSESAIRRQVAVGALSSTRSPSAVAALVDALRDESSAVRSQAVGALVQIGDKSAVAALESLRNDSDPGVRVRVARAIQELTAASGPRG